MNALETADIIDLDERHVMTTYARAPVVFMRGSGSRLYDAEGREYLDFLCGLAVTSLGHAHPAVAEALAEQARQLLHVSNLFHNDVQPRLAQRLDALLAGATGQHGRCFFANSGAEANEAAIKLARRIGQRAGGPGRYEIVSAMRSFHGRTLTTLAATGQPEKQEIFEPLPSGFRHVPFGDPHALAGAVDDRVCAVMLEVVQAEGGMNVAPSGYLTAVRELCDDRGALLIIDEVQTGLGRTGRWFAFEHESVVPDIVTLAKALGNGVPIGACWAQGDVADGFGPGDHATTFGGQPLAARAALEVLTVLEDEDAPGRAASAGERLTRGLCDLAAVDGVRGLGLLLAAELRPGLDAPRVVRICLESGLVVNALTPSAVRFTPSLLVSDDEIDEALEIFAAALDAAATSSPEVKS